MSENIRTAIQSEVCRAFVALNNNEISDAQAALFRILDQLEQLETLQHTAQKFERDSFQLFLQVG